MGRHFAMEGPIVRVQAWQLVRPRPRNVVVAAIVVAAVVLAWARPAFAHNVAVVGSTSCPDENHLVSWTIHNEETAADRSMIITSATATVGGETYTVDGYEPGIGPDATTVGTTVVPGDVTGTITITVRAAWPDDFRASAEASVELEPPCETPTTTTPTTAPATTAPSTPSTTDSPPVTGGTSPSTAAPPPAPGPGPGDAGGVAGEEAGALPRTGASSTNWALVGVAALTFGSALILVARPKRYARR